MTRIIALFIALSIVGLGISGCSKSNSGAGQASLNLAGSKQGQAVGFADVDGDGITDKLVGAPYASAISGQRQERSWFTRATHLATAQFRTWF